MKANAPALYSFTEEFWQEWDLRDATSVANDVLLRWRSDRQRFPPRAYEARKILCGKGLIHPCGGRSAQLNDKRFVVFLSQLWMKSWEVTVVEARRNTLVGQGFHLPFTIVLFTIIALEVLGTSPTLRTDLSYGPAELFLRRRVHGTVFQPGAFHSFPGLITARGLVEDIFLQLDCQNLSLASNKGSEINFVHCLVPLRGLPGFS